MRRVDVLLMAAAMLITGCSSGAADTTIAAPSTTTTVVIATTMPPTTTVAPTTTVPATTTTAAATTTAPPASLEAKYPVMVTSGLSGEGTQEITVWAPDADGSWPVVYLLHGTGGSARDFAELAPLLVGQGVVVFAADYRSELVRTPEWKDAYWDSECGYRYARGVAADYGGDLDQPVTIVGHSFGATIALSLGLNTTVFGPESGRTSDICPGEMPRPDVVVPLSGCHYEHEGQKFAFDPDLTYDESELVLVVGAEDDVCEAWQSEDATAYLRDRGFDASLVIVDGGNHLTVIFHDYVDGEWLTLPDDPAGTAVVQAILDAIDAAGS